MSKTLAQRKELRARRLILVQALLCAVLFHALLAISFVYKNPPPSVEPGKPLYNHMVTLDNSQEGMVQLNNWLKYHDPTLFIKPSRKFGFSATPHRSQFDVIPQDLRPSNRPVGLTRPASKRQRLLNKPVPVDFLTGYETTPPRPGYRTLTNAASPRNYPVLVDNQQRLLLAPGLKNFNAKGVGRATTLKVIAAGRGLIPRVVLKGTCGRRDLDSLAVNLVLRACVSGKLKTEKEQDLSMIWAAPATGGEK